MIEVKVQPVGTSLGITLPAEVLQQLAAIEGENIYLENMCDGSYRLVKHDEQLLEQITLVESQMHEEDA